MLILLKSNDIMQYAENWTLAIIVVVVVVVVEVAIIK